MKRKHLVLFWGVGISTALFWSLGFSRHSGSRAVNTAVLLYDYAAPSVLEDSAKGFVSNAGVDKNGNSVGNALTAPSGGTTTQLSMGLKVSASAEEIEADENGNPSTGQIPVISTTCVDDGDSVHFETSLISGTSDKVLYNGAPYDYDSTNFEVGVTTDVSVGARNGADIKNPDGTVFVVTCTGGNARLDCACP